MAYSETFISKVRSLSIAREKKIEDRVVGGVVARIPRTLPPFEFRDHVLEVTSEEDAAELREHPFYGKRFFAAGDSGAKGIAPGRRASRASDEAAKAARAARPEPVTPPRTDAVAPAGETDDMVTAPETVSPVPVYLDNVGPAGETDDMIVPPGQTPTSVAEAEGVPERVARPSTKQEAIELLASRDLDVDALLTSRTSWDDINAFAAEQGIAFTD